MLGFLCPKHLAIDTVGFAVPDLGKYIEYRATAKLLSSFGPQLKSLAVGEEEALFRVQREDSVPDCIQQTVGIGQNHAA